MCGKYLIDGLLISTIEDIAGMYSIENEPVPPPLATADPSLPLLLLHSPHLHSLQLSILLHLRHIFFIPSGGDVQGQAGSCLRIAHANFY